MYKIIRSINNNAVLAINTTDNKEVILTGKGIGFISKNRPNPIIDASEIERTFVLQENQSKSAYMELFETADEEVLSVCLDIVTMATKTLGDLHQSLFVVLSGHINFAISRIKESMHIENPLLHEIQMVYPMEYSAALTAIEMLEEELGLTIGEEEAGYIALHLNAARLHQNVKDSLKRTNLIRSLIDSIVRQLGIPFPTGMAYRQLVDHLRGVIERVENDKECTNPLLNDIYLNLSREYHVAQNLGTIFKLYFGRVPLDSEIGYIAIHLYRMVSLMKE